MWSVFLSASKACFLCLHRWQTTESAHSAKVSSKDSEKNSREIQDKHEPAPIFWQKKKKKKGSRYPPVARGLLTKRQRFSTPFRLIFSCNSWEPAPSTSLETIPSLCDFSLRNTAHAGRVHFFLFSLWSSYTYSTGFVPNKPQNTTHSLPWKCALPILTFSLFNSPKNYCKNSPESWSTQPFPQGQCQLLLGSLSQASQANLKSDSRST